MSANFRTEVGAPVDAVVSGREKVLLGSSLLFLVAYALPIVDPEASDSILQVCEVLQVAIWLLFGVDLILSFLRATSKRDFAWTHWLDILAVVLPMLRPLRALRLVSVATLTVRRFDATTSFVTSMLLKAFSTAILLWFIAGLAVTDAERGHHGSIQSVTDGWWWALTTMATVGYGDYVPVTPEGRLIAAALMVLGVAILGVVTAAVAAWFVDKSEQTTRLLERESAELKELRREIEELRRNRGE